MPTNEIATAARAICEEKGISLEAVIEAISAALAAAYRKDFGQKNQNIKVDFDLETAASKVYDEKTVVEDLPPEEELESENEEVKIEEEEKESKKTLKHKNIKTQEQEDTRSFAKATEDKQEMEEAGEDGEEKRRFNPRTELQLKDALLIKADAKIGDIIRTDLETPAEYGRMAAQTAKQVIIQRLREVERTNLMDEFKDKEHEVITGVIQRREGRVVLVDLGRTAGILTPEGQVPGERYESGQRVKVYVEEVRSGAKGPEIVLSRASDEIVRKIFMLEIPEISNGLVEIKSIAREAGSRTKIAVTAAEENVDPIGSCVGQRGARIQTIISELGGEKVDIIEYNEDAAKFVIAALAPAKIINVEINEREHMAVAFVAADQQSLAIGRGGQNVRLAAKLTGWRIDIKEAKGSKKEEVKSEKEEEKKVESEKASEPASVETAANEAVEEAVSEEKPKKRGKKSKKEEVKSSDDNSTEIEQ
jgi:N utilization substance protein A